MTTERNADATQANQQPAAQKLLACGVVAGPLYVAITLTEALSRDGFDLTRHRFTLLTAQDLGWIHQLNMLMVGMLTVRLAIGMARVLRTGRGAVWAPRLLGLVGAAYLFGGLVTADAVIGFSDRHHSGPTAYQLAGRRPECISWREYLVSHRPKQGDHSVVIGAWFAARRRQGWAWFYAVAVSTTFAALTGVGLMIGGNPLALPFLMTP